MRTTLFLLLSVLTISIRTQAQTISEEISLQKGLFLSQDDCGYTIQYDIGEYKIVNNVFSVDKEQITFSSIEFIDDYYERIDEVGRPAIPFYGCDLRIPDNLSTNDITISVNLQTKTFKLDYDFLPTQLYEESAQTIIYFDKEYYSAKNPQWFTEEYQWEIYERPRSSGLNFTIYPFHYEPSSRTLTITTSAIYRIEIRTCKLIDFLKDNNILANTYYDNYIDTPFKFNDENIIHQLVHKATYLIISSDIFQNTIELNQFISYKKDIGYNIVVEYVDTKFTPKKIISILETYKEKYPDLLYVLLIGSPELIPFSAGTKNDKTDPPTDLDYIRLPSYNKKRQFNYSYYLGRWPVSNTKELESIVSKTIKNEKELGQYIPSRVSIFSGSWHHDTYLYHNATRLAKIISSIKGMSVYLRDGRYNEASAKIDLEQEITGQHKEIPWIFIYCGHGSIKRIGPPYDLYYDNICNLQNFQLQYQPFGFAFTCLVGDVHHTNNFTRYWLHDNNGGVTMLSSSTISVDPPNRYYSQNTFSLLKEQKNMSIGAFVCDGKKKYYSKCKTEPRWRTIRRYNLYGDPSLYLLGIDWQTGIPQKIKSNETEAKQYKDIVMHKAYEGSVRNNSAQVKLFSINGNCIYEGLSDYMSLTSLSSGMYILYIQTEAEIITKKIFIP